jgi:hypothetical protein
MQISEGSQKLTFLMKEAKIKVPPTTRPLFGVCRLLKK